MSNFRDKYGPWALVSGASSGMGAAFARQLAARELNVVLVARREDRLRALSEDLKRSVSAQTRVVSADLSRDDFIPRLAWTGLYFSSYTVTQCRRLSSRVLAMSEG